MLVVLALTACLVSDPLICKDLRLKVEAPPEASSTPYWCQHIGQMELVKWTEKNPGWRVTRFTCPRPDAGDEEA